MYDQGKIRGSVFLELALEAMKNSNWPFLVHLVHPFSTVRGGGGLAQLYLSIPLPLYQ